MNATQEVREQYKQAARTYIEHLDTKEYPKSIAFYEGRLSGLDVALSCLGVDGDEIREMFNACQEEVRAEQELETIEKQKDERAQEDVGPGDVNYDEEGFVIEQDLKRLQPELEQQAEQAFTEQEELDAIERPASQAQVEADESEEGITALKMLIRKYGYCRLELEITHLRDTVMFNPQLEQEETDQ